MKDTQHARHPNLFGWQNRFEITLRSQGEEKLSFVDELLFEHVPFSIQAYWIAKELIPVMWLLVDWVQWLQLQLLTNYN